MLTRTIQHDVTKSGYIRLLAFSCDDQRKAEIAEWYGLIGWLKVGQMRIDRHFNGNAARIDNPKLGLEWLRRTYLRRSDLQQVNAKCTWVASVWCTITDAATADTASYAVPISAVRWRRWRMAEFSALLDGDDVNEFDFLCE
jgi:hypothetical protein